MNRNTLRTVLGATLPALTALFLVLMPGLGCDIESPYLEEIEQKVAEDEAGALVPGGIIVSKTSLTTTEAGGTDSFTIRLTSQPTSNVQISITSSNPNEGTVSPVTLTFTTSNYAAPQTVTVTGVDDVLADGNTNYSADFISVVSDDLGYAAISIPSIPAVNADNDTKGITVSKTSLITTEAGGTDSFTVRLNSQPTADVTIPVSSSDTTEGTVSPSSLTFTTVNYATAQTVTVTGINDAVDDGNVGYSIQFGTISSSDSGYSSLSVAAVAASNTDNDTAGVTVNPVTSTSSRLATTEEGGTASFTVVLTSLPTGSVVIGLTSSNSGAGGTVSPESITFTTANYGTAVGVTVTGKDNTTAGYTDYQINVSVSSSDSTYNTMSVNPVYVRNAAETRKVATPSVTPNSTSSNRYSSAQTITISDTDSRINPTIRYTTDGSDPTSSSTAYSGTFSVASASNTVKARAFYQDWTDSDAETETYIIPYLLTASGTTGVTNSPGIWYTGSNRYQILVPSSANDNIKAYTYNATTKVLAYADPVPCLSVTNPVAITYYISEFFLVRDGGAGYDVMEHWNDDVINQDCDHIFEFGEKATDVNTVTGIIRYGGKLYIAHNQSSLSKVKILDDGDPYTILGTYSTGVMYNANGLASFTHYTNGGYIAVADSYNNKVHLWNVSLGSREKSWNVTSPSDICADDNTTLYTDYAYIISLGSPASVVIYNATNDTQTNWFPIHADSRRITMDTTYSRLFILRSDGHLDVYVPN